MREISIAKGMELEKRVFITAAAIDEAETTEEKLRAYEEAYKQSAMLLVWYNNLFGSVAGLVEEATKDIEVIPGDTPTNQ